MVNLESPVSNSLHLSFMYPLLISLAMFICFTVAVYKFEIKKVDWTPLIIIAAIIVPLSLMGASFVGKIAFYKKEEELTFWKLFAFWDSGLAIHGGIITAILLFIPAGIWVQKRYSLSIWFIADIVFENVLLAQAIGRWGNFFNHELLGPEAGEYGKVLLWLPEWLRANTASTIGYNGTGTQYHPIFLYESIGLFLAWLVVIIIPFVLRSIRKPTKLHPEKYQLNLKDSVKKMLLVNRDYKNSYIQIWNDAFYLSDHSDRQEYFLQKIIEIEELKNLNWVQKKWKKCKLLQQINNPDNYLTLKSGTVFSWYLFSWNFVRIGLESIKDDGILFIKFNKPLSISLIVVFTIISLLALIWFQFIGPNLIRKPGLTYEKKYFKIKK